MLDPSVQVTAVIPAAGSGRRMNANINKIWLPLCGQSVLAHTLNIFLNSKFIDHIVLAVNQAETDDFAKFLTAISANDSPNNHSGVSQNQGSIITREKSGRVSLVEGGAERQHSVANALQYLKSWSGWLDKAEKFVVIHDAARALLTIELLEKAILAGLQYKAVGVGVPVKDTIKQADNEGIVTATLERSRLWTIQTPQVFDFQLLVDCYEKVAGISPVFSDDCSVVEYCNYPVKLIAGSYENLKITTPEDLVVAEAILRKRAHEGGK